MSEGLQQLLLIYGSILVVLTLFALKWRSMVRKRLRDRRNSHQDALRRYGA